MSSTDAATLTRYLDEAQDSANGNVDQEKLDAIQAAFQLLWDRIQRRPNTYLMTPLEYRIFTYCNWLVTLGPNPIAQRAVRRHHDNTRRQDGGR